MNCKFYFSVSSIFIVFAVCPVFADVKNLGIVGDLYDVAEPDITRELKRQAVNKSLAEHDTFHEKMESYQPGDLHHLPRAAEDRTFLTDMTYTLDHDLRDGDGKVIYPRDFTFNPLDYVSFPGGMVVINGDDPAQVKWFLETPYATNHQVRLLLAGGYATKLSQQFKRSVFYLTDEIAERLQLKAAPSLVIQTGDMLQVQEFFIAKEKAHAIR